MNRLAAGVENWAPAVQDCVPPHRNRAISAQLVIVPHNHLPLGSKSLIPEISCDKSRAGPRYTRMHGGACMTKLALAWPVRDKAADRKGASAIRGRGDGKGRIVGRDLAMKFSAKAG